MREATASHLYRIGEKVTFNPGIGVTVQAAGTFTVLVQLPPLGDVLQYRIKSDHEPYERVVSEHQLVRV